MVAPWAEQILLMDEIEMVRQILAEVALVQEILVIQEAMEVRELLLLNT